MSTTGITSKFARSISAAPRQPEAGIGSQVLPEAVVAHLIAPLRFGAAPVRLGALEGA